MIIVGFQGIGKSTLARKDLKIIDFESSGTFVDGVRPENWFAIYANLANELSNQGYIVFVSARKEIREYAKKHNIKFKTIAPTLSLKNDWISKLKERYEKSKLEKDLRALQFAEKYYNTAVNDLLSEDDSISITDINYNLIDLIKEE